MRIFWSYAKLDNKKPHKLTRLRNAFNTSLDQVTGSNNTILVDESDLKWGVKWKEEIKLLIEGADSIITILSPSYFNSKMCIYELEIALKSNKTILPLYYRNCQNGLKSNFKEENNKENKELNKTSVQISEIQYKDFRKLRNKDIHSEIVQDFLDNISEQIT